MTTATFQQLAGGVLSIPDSEHKLGKLRLRHWTEYCEFIALYDYHKAKRNGADKELLDELFRDGLKKSLSPTSPEVLLSFSNPICLAKMLEIGLKVANPNISQKQISEFLDDEDKYADYVMDFLKLQGFDLTKVENSEGNLTPPNLKE